MIGTKIQLTNFWDGKPSILVILLADIVAISQNADKTTSILTQSGKTVITTVWESELQWIIHEIEDSGMNSGTFRYDGRDKEVQARIRKFRENTLGWEAPRDRPSRQSAIPDEAFGRPSTGAADVDRTGPGQECHECGDRVHDDEYVRKPLPSGEHFSGCINCYQSAADEEMATSASA